MKFSTHSLLRLVMLVMLALLSAGMQAFAAPVAPVQAPERSPYWRERTSFFHDFGHQADVVMVGDSLTDGAEWREMFPDQRIVNRGIDSDTTEGVLARLDDILMLKPKAVFVMIGINDFADLSRSADAVFLTYQAIVSRLERSGARVIVQSTLPCNEAKGTWKSCAAINGKIRQLDARLGTLASRRISYVDLLPALTSSGGLRDEFTYDGVHLNGPGYQVWKDAIARLMPAAVKPRRAAP
ncbi:MAG: GDSL-type esterase/lipase family protein [Polaromonas sp.]